MKSNEYLVNGTSALKNDYVASNETPIISFKINSNSNFDLQHNQCFSNNNRSLLDISSGSIRSSLEAVFSSYTNLAVKDTIPFVGLAFGTLFTILTGLALGI